MSNSKKPKYGKISIIFMALTDTKFTLFWKIYYLRTRQILLFG